jgi:uncharacterized damage-inducible protein DinB
MKIKSCFVMLACCSALAIPLSCLAQSQATPQPSAAPAAGPIAPADTLGTIFDDMRDEVIGAADAMPADKYDFAPNCTGDFKGVRTFGEQVRHLAQANYSFFRRWNVPGGVDPKTLDSLKTKDELMKALRDSFAFDDAAIKTITPENAFAALPGPPQYKLTRVSMVAYAMAHSRDHYGQMVEYLRMNGIIPPASRKQN